MSRQSPHRNGRNQGLKVKHVLQLSVLLGVGIWLLYQLQQPLDRKSTVDVARYSENDSENIDLGRKDLKNDVRTEDADEEEEKRVVDHSDEELNSKDEKAEDSKVREVASMVEDTRGESSDEENNNQIEENANNEGIETEDLKPENEGSGSGNHEVEIKDEDLEIHKNDGDHTQNNDEENMEENESKDDDGKGKEVESIQILGAKENVGELESTDKKIEENKSNETVAETKDQEIKSDEVKQEVQENHDIQSGEVKNKEIDVSLQISDKNDADDGKIEAEGSNKNSTSDLSSFDGLAENRSNGTDDGAKETGEAEKEKVDSESSDGSVGLNEQQNKVDVNSDSNSIPTEDIASNATILEHSENSNPSDENSGLDSTGKADDTNGNHNDTHLTEATPEKSSIQEMDEKPSATNNDSESDTSESHPDDTQNSQVDSSIRSALQDEKNAQTDINTLPNSGTVDNNHQEAASK